MNRLEIEKLAALERTHWWYAARRSLLTRAISELPPGSAVDIGAGAGGNTRVLRDSGWKVTAVELSPTGAAIARDRGIPVIRADATALPFPDRTFDLVVSMDLWEHIPEDRLAAEEAFRVMKPGGRLFLAVPCDMSLWSDHDVAVGHVRRYEIEGLVQLTETAGFEVRNARSWNVLLRPAVRWHRRRGVGVAGESSSDLASVPKPLNLILRAIVEAERWLPLAKRRGVTLLVEAQRPGMKPIQRGSSET